MIITSSVAQESTMQYVQSKDDGKYLQFQRDHTFNLYYMDISKADGDEHCYLNTVNQGEALYSILDQKRAEAVKSYKNAVRSHPTKISSTHWSVTP